MLVHLKRETFPEILLTARLPHYMRLLLLSYHGSKDKFEFMTRFGLIWETEYFKSGRVAQWMWQASWSEEGTWLSKLYVLYSSCAYRIKCLQTRGVILYVKNSSWVEKSNDAHEGCYNPWNSSFALVIDQMVNYITEPLKTIERVCVSWFSVSFWPFSKNIYFTTTARSIVMDCEDCWY